MQSLKRNLVVVVFAAGLKIVQDQGPRGGILREMKLRGLVGDPQVLEPRLIGDGVPERHAVVECARFHGQAAPAGGCLDGLHRDRVVVVPDRVRLPRKGIPSLILARRLRGFDAHGRAQRRRAIEHQPQVRPRQHRLSAKRHRAPRTVAIVITRSPLGDFRTTAPVCAAAGIAASRTAASFRCETISASDCCGAVPLDCAGRPRPAPATSPA
jgi:hypothetical protein